MFMYLAHPEAYSILINGLIALILVYVGSGEVISKTSIICCDPRRCHWILLPHRTASRFRRKPRPCPQYAGIVCHINSFTLSLKVSEFLINLMLSGKLFHVLSPCHEKFWHVIWLTLGIFTSWLLLLLYTLSLLFSHFSWILSADP